MNIKQEETEIGIFRQGNDWQGNGELAELVQRIESAVAKYRLTFADEKQLQDQECGVDKEIRKAGKDLCE